MLRLGRLVYGRLLFAMQIFVLAVRLCLKRDFRHIAHQSRQSLIATTSLRFALGFCRRSSPAAACSIICHDIAQKKSSSQDCSFLCGYSATISTFPPNLPLRKGGHKFMLIEAVAFFVRIKELARLVAPRQSCLRSVVVCLRK